MTEHSLFEVVIELRKRLEKNPEDTFLKEGIDYLCQLDQQLAAARSILNG